MKNVNDLKREIDLIKNESVDGKLKARQRNRIKELNQMSNYLASNPSEEFIKSELDKKEK